MLATLPAPGWARWVGALRQGLAMLPEGLERVDASGSPPRSAPARRCAGAASSFPTTPRVAVGAGADEDPFVVRLAEPSGVAMTFDPRAADRRRRTCSLFRPPARPAFPGARPSSLSIGAMPAGRPRRREAGRRLMRVLFFVERFRPSSGVSRLSLRGCCPARSPRHEVTIVTAARPEPDRTRHLRGG